MRIEKKKHNYLFERVNEVLTACPRGALLDLGCGSGDLGKHLQEAGFAVTGADMDVARFRHQRDLPFVSCDLGAPLPFPEGSFDYVVLLEVVEHVYNPDGVIREIARVLRAGGRLVLSTPNILNIRSRLRFLFEGSFDFFREPLLEYSQRNAQALQNIHVIPWRYNELEYLLARNGLRAKKIYCDDYSDLSVKALGALFKPLLWLQARIKEGRSGGRGGVDFSRMNRLALSNELYYGRHLIVEATKE